MEGWKRVSSFNLSVFLGVSSDLQWSPARSSQRSTQSGSLPPAPSLLRWQCVRTNRRLRVPHVSRMYSVFRSLYVTWPTPDRRLMLVKSPKYLAVSPPAVSINCSHLTPSKPPPPPPPKKIHSLLPTRRAVLIPFSIPHSIIPRTLITAISGQFTKSSLPRALTNFSNVWQS